MMRCPTDVATILLDMLSHGLLAIRGAGNAKLAALHADHLHNLPSLIDHYSPDRLRYYWEAERPGFMTLLSDGERLTGAYALGQEAGEWLQQATVAIRARVPLPVLFDVIQPFPTFSEAFLTTLTDLEAQTAMSPATPAAV